MKREVERLLKRYKFRMFSIDTSEEDAITEFKRLHGYKPEYIDRNKVILVAGPIREGKDNGR